MEEHKRAKPVLHRHCTGSFPDERKSECNKAEDSVCVAVLPVRAKSYSINVVQFVHYYSTTSLPWNK